MGEPASDAREPDKLTMAPPEHAGAILDPDRDRSRVASAPKQPVHPMGVS